MKKIFITLLITNILLILGCAQQIKNLDSKGENIICFGNSITAGTGAGEAQDYPSILSEKLGLPVINAGKSGDITQSALLRIEEDVLSKDPKLVIVELGGNDFLKKIPIEETKRNLEKIVDLIQNQGAMVVLIELHYPIFMGGYYKIYREIAKRKQTVLVRDVLKEILMNPSLKSDNIHPNSKGYQVLAERIYKLIKPLLK